MTSMGTHLRQADWMSCLPPDLASYAESRVVERSVDAGEFVYTIGTQPEFWIGVIEGLLLMCRNSASGRTTAIASVRPGGWIGEASLLFLEARRSDLVAVRPSRVACIPRSVFKRLYDESIEFNHYLIEKLAHRFGGLARLVSSDRLLPPAARVAMCIAALMSTESMRASALHIDVTQAELGTLTGLSRQHVNKALHALAAMNVIAIERRGMRVTDTPGLLAYIGRIGN